MPRGPWVLLLTLMVAGCNHGGAVPTAQPNAAADACAAHLAPRAAVIYHDIAPYMRPDTNLEAIMRRRVMMLIVAGDMSMGAARPAAEQAAECLELFQN